MTHPVVWDFVKPLTRRDLPGWVSAVLAALAGALVAVGFAPISLWPGPLLGVGLLTWLVASRPARQAIAVGAIFGLSLNAITLHWVAVLGVPVAAALIVFMTLWSMLLAWATSRVTQLAAWPLWVAASWVAIELVSGTVPFGGFPWNRLGYTAIEQPLAGWFSWIGLTGVSFLVALSSLLLLLALTAARTRVVASSAVLVLLLTGLLLQQVPINQPEESVNVGVVHGGVNRHEHGTGTYARSVTVNALSETVFLLADQRANQRPGLDFIVWPENATDYDPLVDKTAGASVEHAVQLAGVPIFVGAVMQGPIPDSRQTSSIWWHPETGPGERYDKRNLVPFGEWIPFRDVLLPAFPILKQVGLQSVPGTTPGVVAAPTDAFQHLRVGTIICFELAWDSTSYDTVRHGAQVIVTQSNTNTYAGTFEPHQQMVINQVRAAEMRREVVVSTLNGLSGLVDAHGRVVDETIELTSTHRTYEVPLRYNTTLAVRIGPWLGYLLSLVAVGALGWSLIPRRSATLDAPHPSQ